MMGDQYRRALLAFPDEDVLVGTRLLAADGFRAFAGLADVVPSPGHKASGEERAWGRRLAKRFGAEGRLDDRTFVLAGDGSVAGGLDFVASKPKDEPELGEIFTQIDAAAGIGSWPSDGRWPRTWPRASWAPRSSRPAAGGSSRRSFRSRAPGEPGPRKAGRRAQPRGRTAVTTL